MYIILGGTGHVGSAAARALLEQGARVKVVGHDPAKAKRWTSRGAEFACVDIHDAEALRAVLRSGRRAFLLNPPADPSTDTDAEERRTIAAILSALSESGLEKVVAASTYGAQPGERLGDLNTLHELEKGLAAQPIPATIQRAAYYYSNWDMALDSASKNGVVESFLPEDFTLPMVSPEDLGRSAARLLSEPVEQGRIHYVEGPQRCSPADVARAFAGALGKKVRVVEIPKADWIDKYRSIGFSDAAAQSYARMTEMTVEQLEMPENPIRGEITLDDYVAGLVRASQRSAA